MHANFPRLGLVALSLALAQMLLAGGRAGEQHLGERQ